MVFSVANLPSFLLFSGHMEEHGWQWYPPMYAAGPTLASVSFPEKQVWLSPLNKHFPTIRSAVV